MTRRPTHRPAALGTIGFIIAAVLFAGVAGVLLAQLLDNQYSQEPIKPIVVAKRRVASGQPLRKEDFDIARWPQSAIPEGAFTKISDVVKSKQVPLIPLVKGVAVLRSHLSEPASGMGIASMISEGKRAMSIRTDDPVTLARLLYPGAIVDVLSTVERWNQDIGGQQIKTRVVLQRVTVLAVGEDIDPISLTKRRRKQEESAENSEGAFSENPQDSKEVRGVVTLLVGPEEAEQLALAARDGKIDIVLRNPKDKGLVQTSGATRSQLVGEEEPTNEKHTKSLMSILRKQGRSSRAAAKSKAKRHSRKRAVAFTKSAQVNESPGIQIYRGGGKAQ